MCGRTACTLEPDQISKLCRYKRKDGKYSKPSWGKSQEKYHPGYNKAPQSYCPILVSGAHFNNGSNFDRNLEAMRWGLIPSWFKGNSNERVSYNMNNARSDTLMEKRSYSIPLRKGQRCVVVADGFYEWKMSLGGKQPYYIYFPQQNDETLEGPPSTLLAMAGIYEKTWFEDEEVYSFTVITVDASDDFSWLHHRMPALLVNDEEISSWLDSENVPLDQALTLIKPKTHLKWHAVSKFVSNSRNEGPECIKKIDLNNLKENTKFKSESKRMMDWLEAPRPLSTAQSSNASISLREPKKRPQTSLDKWVKKQKTTQELKLAK